jgi:hypothetical protein
MRPVILLLFCLGLSSCNKFAQGQTEGEPTAPPEQTVIEPSTTPVQPVIEPTTTPEIFMPIPAEQRTFEKVRATLAGVLNVDPLIISLMDLTPVDWPDSCLGLPTPGEMCAQVVTPGFRVRVQEGGAIYEFHTDLEAKGIRQVK